MSVHMFRAQLSRMHGEDSATAPDPIARLLDHDAEALPANNAPPTRKPCSNARDTRGILTHVVHQVIYIRIFTYTQEDLHACIFAYIHEDLHPF